MFLPNVPGATFIPGATSIPESRVIETKKQRNRLIELNGVNSLRTVGFLMSHCTVVRHKEIPNQSIILVLF